MDLLLRVLVVVGVVVATTVVGRVLRARDGRVRHHDRASGAATGAALLDAATQALIGLDPFSPGPRAVLFGSPTCAPCDTVKGVLGDLRVQRPDLQWTYVDAADRLDLADAHGVRRVPTLLVADADGRVVSRASGVPDRRELLAALPG